MLDLSHLRDEEEVEIDMEIENLMSPIAAQRMSLQDSSLLAVQTKIALQDELETKIYSSSQADSYIKLRESKFMRVISLSCILPREVVSLLHHIFEQENHTIALVIAL